MIKYAARYIKLILLLEGLILASGYFILAKSGTGIIFREVALLSSLFMVITLTAIVIFFRGQEIDPAGQTIHSLAAVTLKFLLELILALIWFFVAKKTSPASVILFFVLYLAFTLFSIIIMVKTLKSKVL